MNMPPDDFVFLGLSLSSSWGNGHATTYRALLRGLARLGCRVLFLERDKPWYAQNRDLPAPDFCDLDFYTSLADLRCRFAQRLTAAKVVIVGSYVPEGIAVIDYVLSVARGRRGFYDIDTPITLAALTRGNSEFIAPSQISALDFYLSFTGGPVLERLRAQFGAIHPVAFYCSVDPTLYRPTGAALKWHLGYLGTYSPDRQPALERLLLAPARKLPQHKFVVAGAQFPESIVWPNNVERIEHLPPAEHAAFYSAQYFTLNITRVDMVEAGWSPSVRLFEAAACGTPIISDRWPGLTALLPEGEAILIADDTATVVDALTSADARRRLETATRARNIVLDDHTGEARARQLVSILNEVQARHSTGSTV